MQIHDLNYLDPRTKIEHLYCLSTSYSDIYRDNCVGNQISLKKSSFQLTSILIIILTRQASTQSSTKPSLHRTMNYKSEKHELKVTVNMYDPV